LALKTAIRLSFVKIKSRSKTARGYANNPKKDILEKKIPFNLSIKRKVVLDFNKTCADMGVSKNEIAEELLLEFLRGTKL
jgi:hypothetical protein